MKKFLEAGQIVNTHGIRGEVRITPWADSPDFLRGFDRLYIDGEEVVVESARTHKNMLITKLRGIDDVNAAMRMKSKVVFIDRDDAKLPEGDFFIQDILGARVVTEDGQTLGVLEDILDRPASDIYVVRGEREILIPAVSEFILNTDTAAGIITVRLIEGM
jgi:16S rRNA processing protein RimM